jgi:hypothetical protein
MRRNIKFRIPYFKPDGSFYDFSYWGTIDHKLEPSLDHGSFTSPASNGYTKGWHEQFIGLIDKNGKEIYDGDIILTNTGKPMVITWSYRFASFCIERDGWAFKHWFGEAMEANECEIIGNIYQNQELLNPTP